MPVSPCDHLQQPPLFNSPHRNINVCELWPVVLGVRCWAKYFSNSRIHAITDNMQVLTMLNTGRSANKTCMSWLQELFWLCFIYNIDIHASYIRSADNHLADALSRLAYEGVAPKCYSLLESNNICCFHLFRTSDDQHQDAPGETQDDSMGAIYQEGPAVSDILLPQVL